PCSPATVGGFSAAAYFFGRKLHQEVGVPIGLINTSWGATPAEAWTSLEKLQSNPLFQPILDAWEQRIADYPEALRKYNEETVPAWEKKVEEAKAAGQEPPRKPNAPDGPDSARRPANLFNSMINPIVGLAIKGAIWYQGESNAGGGYLYRTLLPAMIEDWRGRWGQGDFPFLIVQLANFTRIVEQPAEAPWADVRESQLLTALNVPNCGLAVTIDVGEALDIHPRNKQAVGDRLALWALGTTYGEDIVYSGPIYTSMEVEGTKIRLHFDHVGGGLTTMATENAPDPGKLVGFQIAGEDRQWVWADASIDGDTVLVGSDAVPAPVAVRYAWAANPICNLFNAEGLPASPFRTDDWQLVTQPKPQ
ncbi:MAG TPA: sialate O-acetylesterase, partial [Armatimonadota bacterium]|nr:sialate O-acetylesterase [Armatimonadota bacterium]